LFDRVVIDPTREERPSAAISVRGLHLGLDEVDAALASRQPYPQARQRPPRGAECAEKPHGVDPGAGDDPEWWNVGLMRHLSEADWLRSDLGNDDEARTVGELVTT
jgi:hypothetical protein